MLCIRARLLVLDVWLGCADLSSAIRIDDETTESRVLRNQLIAYTLRFTDALFTGDGIGAQHDDDGLIAQSISRMHRRFTGYMRRSTR